MASQRNPVLLSSRFRYPDRRFLYARARLFADRIELTGIHWSGITRHIIALSDIVRLSWRDNTEQTANLKIYLRGGDVVRLWVQGPGLWKYQVDACLGKGSPPFGDRLPRAHAKGQAIDSA